MFYTNVEMLGDNILFRGFDRGKRILRKIPYQPKLYVRSNKPTKFKDLQGGFLEELQFESISEARDFYKKYQGVENFPIFGFNRYQYAFLSEIFPKEVQWDVNEIVVGYLDIEVASDEGFPEPEHASQEIKIGRAHV